MKRNVSVILIATVLLVALVFTTACSSSTPSTTAPAGTTTPAASKPAASTTAPVASTTAPAAPTTAPAANAIHLKWVSTSPLSPSSPGVADYLKSGFFDRVTKMTNGQIVFDYVGASETIATNDQALAVQNGVVDFASPYVSTYESLVPGINAAILSQYTAVEERSNGVFEALQALHKQANLMYLGRPGASEGGTFYTYINKQINSQTDFKGLRMGSGAASAAVATGWGATNTVLQSTDYYTAMDTKMVDGLCGVPISNWGRSGGFAITKYLILPGYFMNSSATLMNMNSWNKLTQAQKDIFNQAMALEEKDDMVGTTSDFNNYIQKAKDAGVQIVTFAPDLQKWYLQTAYDAVWAAQAKKFPDVTAKLKTLLSKP